MLESESLCQLFFSFFSLCGSVAQNEALMLECESLRQRVAQLSKVFVSRSLLAVLAGLFWQV